MDERASPSVRYSEVRFGDDLRRISLRELGDAGRWVEIALLNNLRPPYIADEAALGVLTYGEQIVVPAPASGIPADVTAAELYGADVRVNAKRLEVENGDFALTVGVPNLTQSLIRRLDVAKRELAFHPDFGSYVRSLIGRVNGPTANQLAAFYVKSALLEDERVDSISSCTAEAVGDQIKVSGTVVPITGQPVDFRTVL